MSRRRIPPTSRPTPTTFQPTNSPLNNEFSEPIVPKHIAFIQSCFTQGENEILSELIIFMFTLIAASSQFVHLYRSVWWHPESYHNYSMNFYLIDKSLVVFIFVMIGRRFFYCLLVKGLEFICPDRYYQLAEKCLKYVFLGMLEFIFLICNIKIFQNYSIMNILYLIYPIILYLVIFKCKIDPFLRIMNSRRDMPFMGEVMHSCSSNAVDIRQEVDTLRNDFNTRFKQIIFTSVMNAYYSAFAPCAFANKHLYFSKFWVSQHLFFTFVSLFTMCATYCLPIRYCDVLHRSAIHLGQWTKLGPRATHPPPLNWSKTQTFAYGSYVKYFGDVFKSTAECTSALPADSGHHRFYILFKNPSMLYFIICSIQLSTVLIQLILIIYCKEYIIIISIGLLLITNYYTLFRLVRDYLIVKNIYHNGS
ncbi:transmembrane protein 39A [Chironomus tepperi]|uniref:transmembrane protein 39A n=1 Tax=Chironomus tepperi TaxID=113505 RepID=UPI00391F0A53